MSTNPADHKPSNFTARAVGLIAVTAVLAWGLSLVVVPIIDGARDGLSAYASICRALGLRPAPAGSPIVAGPSTIIWTEDTFLKASSGDATRGAALAADTCVSCHYPNGMSTDPAKIPSLAGQSARAIYKQLWDVKSGARINPDMKPLLEKLEDEQIRDLAAFYGALPARNADIREPAGEMPTMLVLRGDSSRALPPCAACHDSREGGPLEAPNLRGQYPNYIAAQLHAYAKGDRHNDLFGRMRTIASKLSEGEIAALSTYYNALH